jgi:hypothetical protein
MAASYLDGATDSFTVFNYGGNAYVLVDYDTSGSFSTDASLIPLTGVNATQLNGTNFVA